MADKMALHLSMAASGRGTRGLPRSDALQRVLTTLTQAGGQSLTLGPWRAPTRRDRGQRRRWSARSGVAGPGGRSRREASASATECRSTGRMDDAVTEFEHVVCGSVVFDQ